MRRGLIDPDCGLPEIPHDLNQGPRSSKCHSDGLSLEVCKVMLFYAKRDTLVEQSEIPVSVREFSNRERKISSGTQSAKIAQLRGLTVNIYELSAD